MMISRRDSYKTCVSRRDFMSFVWDSAPGAGVGLDKLRFL